MNANRMNQGNWQGGQWGRPGQQRQLWQPQQNQGWPYYGNVPRGGAWWSGSGRSNLGNYQPYLPVRNGGWYGPYGYGGYGGYGQGNPPGYVPGSYLWNGPGYGNMAPPNNPQWNSPALAGQYNNTGPRFVGPSPQQVGTGYHQQMRNSPWGPGLYNYGYPGPYGYWWNAGLGYNNYAWNGTGWNTPTGYVWNGPYQGGGYAGSSY